MKRRADGAILALAMSDDAKKIILARRARFLAAAVVGLAADGCGKTAVTLDAGTDSAAADAAPAPEGPLAVPPTYDPNKPFATPPPEPEPHPCLSVAFPNDAAAPRPCLKPPAPHPCLSPARPNCDPPFTIDANGVKHFKPSCLE